MPTVNSAAAERLLDAAMHLFATKGYEETSVGDIQVAAGLTYGSGALYKHFSSKQAVLESGITRFIETASAERAELSAIGDGDLAGSLAAVANAVLTSFRRDRDTLRIVWRDLERFPDLQDAVRRKRIRATYDDFGKWLTDLQNQGRIDVEDPNASASVLLAALAFFHILDALMGDTPGGVSAQRFIRAWATLAYRALSPQSED